MRLKINLSMLALFFGCSDIGKEYNWDESQPAGFSRTFGTLGYDYGWSAAHSPLDDGIIIIGKRAVEINGQSDMWVIKTDNRGMLEWDRIFGGLKSEDGLDIISTSDGGFLFVGYTWSYGKNQQIYAIKSDFYGNIIWEKNFGGSMWEIGFSVIELKEGGYVIAGFSNSPGIS